MQHTDNRSIAIESERAARTTAGEEPSASSRHTAHGSGAQYDGHSRGHGSVDNDEMRRLASQLLAEAGSKHVAVSRAAEKFDACLREGASKDQISQAVSVLVTLSVQSESSALMVVGLQVMLEQFLSMHEGESIAESELPQTLSFSLALAATRTEVDVLVLCALASCCAACVLPLGPVDAVIILRGLLRLASTAGPASRKAMDAALRAFVTILAGAPVDAEEIAALLALMAHPRSHALARIVTKYTPILHARRELRDDVQVAVFLELTHRIPEGCADARAAFDCLTVMLRQLPESSGVYANHECRARLSSCMDEIDCQLDLRLRSLTVLLAQRHLRVWARDDIAFLATSVFDVSQPHGLLHAVGELLTLRTIDDDQTSLMQYLLSPRFYDADQSAGPVVILARSLFRVASRLHRNHTALVHDCADRTEQLCRSLARYLDSDHYVTPAVLHRRALQLAQMMPDVWPDLHATAVVLERMSADEDVHLCAHAIRHLLHACGILANYVGSEACRDAQSVLAATLAKSASVIHARQLVAEATVAGAHLHCWPLVFNSLLRLHAADARDDAAAALLSAVVGSSGVAVEAISAAVTASSAALLASPPDSWLLERLVDLMVDMCRHDVPGELFCVCWRLSSDAFLQPFASSSSCAVQLVAAAAYTRAVESLLQHSCSLRRDDDVHCCDHLQAVQTPDSRKHGVSLLSPALRIAALGACDEVFEHIAGSLACLVRSCDGCTDRLPLQAVSWCAMLDLCGHAATMQTESVLNAFYFALESAATALQRCSQNHRDVQASLLSALFAWSRQTNTPRALDALGLVVVLTPQLYSTPQRRLGAEMHHCEDMPPPPPPPLGLASASTNVAMDHTAALSGLASVALCCECTPVVRIEALNAVFDCAAGCAAVHAWTCAEWRGVLADSVCVLLDGLLAQHAAQEDSSVFLLTASCLVLERTTELFHSNDWSVMGPCLLGVAHMFCACLEVDWQPLCQHAGTVIVRLAQAVSSKCEAVHWAVFFEALATSLSAAGTDGRATTILASCASVVALARYSSQDTAEEFSTGLCLLADAVIAVLRGSRISQVQYGALDVLAIVLPVPACTRRVIDACVAVVEQPSMRETAVAARALRVLEAAPLSAVEHTLPSLLRRKLALASAASELTSA